MKKQQPQIKIQQEKRRKLVASLILLLGIFLLFYIFVLPKKSEDSSKKQERSVSVVTAEVKTADVPVYLTAIGNIESNSSVIVKPQIAGQLIKILFKEGQQVKAGELLAQIDQRPYQAQLSQYEGQLQRDQALLDNAKLDLERYQKLWKTKSVSKQILDTQIALVKQYEGTVRLNIGLLENARINLSYCLINSPIDGTVGLRLIDVGNIVDKTTTITIVNDLNQINASFSIPEDQLVALLPKLKNIDQIKIEAHSQDRTKLLGTGKLVAIDNQIDNSTGTIKLKAQFENKDNIFFPNQFVNIKLLLTTIKNAIIVPKSAVLTGNNGSYVYRVEKDNKVKIIQIITGENTGNNIVVNSGLNNGDVVVSQGSDRLVEGTKINTSEKNFKEK